MSFYILDTETTGITAKDQIIELAYFEIPSDRKVLTQPVDIFSLLAFLTNKADPSLFRPSVPIHPEAEKVHGISYKDLIKEPPSSSIKLPEDMKFMIGHNIAFDWRMLGKPDVSLICTLKIAKKLWPKEKEKSPANYTLTGLVEFLYPEEAEELLGRKYHRAMDDCKLCYFILLKILEKLEKVESLEQLLIFCK